MNMNMNLNLNMIPDDIAANIRSMFFSMFGGPDRLDCWISQGADEMASMGEEMSVAQVLPMPMQNLVLKPKEVMDTLIDKLHALKVWEYCLKTNGERVKVYDLTSGHLLEEADLELLPALQEKYGDNLREE